MARRFSHFVTNTLLGIDIHERYSSQPHDLDRRAKDVLGPAEIYLEDEPTVAEWFKGLAPTRAEALRYAKSLFPSPFWIRRYNVSWLLGDVVAGITIGMVVVPQAMAYAVLAGLTPVHGLYTSFTGATLYWVFGTSKDIVIGTTAVGSLLVGQVVGRVSEAAETAGHAYDPVEIAHALSMLSGAMLLFFGLLRLGWIIEFIPYVPISAFITAASITIMSTQIPTLLGIPNISSKDPPYWVLINSFRGLPHVRLDAAIGLSSIVLLFGIRNFCAMMEEKQPAWKRTWISLSSLRLTFTILFFTIISYIVHHDVPLTESKFRIVGHIERGFQGARTPMPTTELLGHVIPELPAVAVILVIEHIAIAKAMARLYNYDINPSQEVEALGAANLLSPFVGGYICTGSFGASAILSKSGVRTPLAGLFSATVVVLALYALTGAFCYIPNAALSGLIIHAICNLLNTPKNLFRYWQLSPFELLIWVIGVSLAIFFSLEWSIYVGTMLSICLLLVRLARTKGRFLGLVRVRSAARERSWPDGELGVLSNLTKSQSHTRVVFLPLDRKDSSNPDVKMESPYPGVFVYRLSEGYNYTNQAYHVDTLTKYIMDTTRRMSEEHYEKESDRLWNDAGPRVYKCNPKQLPFLRAVVLDFGAVNNIDITSIQGLVELRNTLDRYSAPDTVEWHFANVHNRWTRRALAVVGFGYPTSQNPKALSNWKPIYSIAPIEEKTDVSMRESCRSLDIEKGEEHKSPRTAENSVDVADKSPMDTRTDDVGASSNESTRLASVSPVDRPFFHIDLNNAVDAAVRGARAMDLAI